MGNDKDSARTGQVTGQVAGQVTGQVAIKVLQFCKEPRKAAEKVGDQKANGYILEIHLWEGGEIQVEKDKLPAGMTIERSKD